MKKNFTLDSAYDGVHLSGVLIAPDSRPKVVLQIAHGMCGCKERFMPLMEYLAENGVACVASDHRGHGGSVKSPNDLGYMYEGGYHALVEDMKLVSDWTKNEYPAIPFVLLGHSMGSMAARLYTKKYDYNLSGLILCGSPAYTPMAKAGIVMAGFLCLFKHGRMRPEFIQRMTSERYNRDFVADGKYGWVCSNPASREEMLGNPLINYTFTSNGAYNLLKMMLETYSPKGWYVTNPQLPIVFLSGEDDPCMRGEKGLHDSVRLMYSVGYHNVTSAIFTHMRHEIINETDKKIVWDDILDFLMKIPVK